MFKHLNKVESNFDIFNTGQDKKRTYHSFKSTTATNMKHLI